MHAATVLKTCGIITEPSPGIFTCWFYDPAAAIGTDGSYFVYNGQYPDNSGGPINVSQTYQNSNQNISINNFNGSGSISGDYIWHELTNAPGGDTWVYQFQLINGDWVQPNVTRIISVDPYDGEVVSTSTPTMFGFTGYVASEDFDDDMYVQLNYKNNASVAGSMAVSLFAIDDSLNPGLEQGEYVYELPSSGFFSFSTTTTLDLIGKYTMTVDIVDPGFLGLSFFGDTLVSTTTSFTVATSTAFDYLQEDNVSAASALSEANAPNCDTVSLLNVKDYVYCLFVPTETDYALIFNSFYNGLLSKWPIGYVTRFVAVVTTETTLQPPPISYTFGSSSPAVLQGLSYEMQLFDHFDEINSIRTDDGENLSIWQVIDKYFTPLVAVAVLFVIFFDLLSLEIDIGSFRTGRRFRKEGSDSVIKTGDMTDDEWNKVKVNDYSNLSEEEWLNLKRNRLI